MNIKTIMQYLKEKFYEIFIPEDISDHKYRNIRVKLLNKYINKLSDIMWELDFTQDLLISATELSYVYNDNIFLCNEGTTRYLKRTIHSDTNDAIALLKFLNIKNIEVKTFVDIGANFGEIALYFARHKPGCKVICIEASIENNIILKHNLNMNNLTDKIELIEKAVSHKKGIVEMSTGNNSMNSIILDSEISKKIVKNTVKVEADTLANLVPLNNIDFIKIDIEGAEPLLKESLLKLKPKAIFIEFSKHNDKKSYLDLFFTLYYAGYEVYDEHGLILEEKETIAKYVDYVLDNKYVVGEVNLASANLWFIRGDT